MRPGGLGAEPRDLVLLVACEVALEPEPLGRVLLVALVGEDVRRHPVEEPPVVRDDDGAAGEVEQRVLERAERLDVQVVGRLVEEQQVAALLEGERQVEPVALAAGEDAGRLLLVRALEPERRHVGARRHLDVADLDVVQAVRDESPRPSCFGSRPAAGLVDVGDLDGLADLEVAGVRASRGRRWS